jgi:hypothetical protein
VIRVSIRAEYYGQLRKHSAKHTDVDFDDFFALYDAALARWRSVESSASEPQDLTPEDTVSRV